jgi:hypothetical protein
MRPEELKKARLLLAMLSRYEDLSVDSHGGSRCSESIFRITELRSRKPRVTLYAKHATEEHGPSGHFWGVTGNHIDALNTNICPWWLVLLFGDQEEGYLLSAGQVNRCISSGNWSSEASRSEYKIHESTLPTQVSRFTTFTDLFRAIGLSKG